MIDNGVGREKLYADMAQGWNWTPRQVSREITIPQLVSIWLRKEAGGWRAVSLEEAKRLVRTREEAR